MSSIDMLREYLRLRAAPTPAQLEDRVLALVRHAYAHVPYYQALMTDAGLRPDDFRTLEDFDRKFPVTHASRYRAVQQESGPQPLVDRRCTLERLNKQTSSGSTGIPVSVYRRPADLAHNNAKTLWHLVHAGLRPWHRAMAITQVQLLVDRDSVLQRFGLFRRRTVHPLMDTGEVIDLIRSERINAIYGNVDYLVELADRLQQQPLPELELLMPGAGLISAATRRYLCRTFRPKRYGEYYGSTETGIIASATSGAYEPDFSSIYFSLGDVTPAADRIRGSILLTSLFSFAQPIIKLELGDLVTVSGYNRHRDLQSRLLSIDGRSNDFLLLADDQRLSATFFYKLLEGFEFVRQFQIRQRRVGCCEILLRLEPGSGTRVTEVDAALRRHGRGRFDYTLHQVEHIALQPTGKRKILISELAGGEPPQPC